MVATDDDNGRVTHSLDDGAFEALIRENQRVVHSLCYRMTGSMADAEDLAQETFLSAYQHWAGFRAEARFSSWLYRIAVNQCLNWQKRRQRQDRLQKDWSTQAPHASTEDAPHAEEIQDALMKIEPKQRAAIILTTYDGLTHAQAARALGCAEATVSWRVFAARRRLKRLLRTMERPEVRP